MDREAAIARVLRAQRLLLDFQGALSEYEMTPFIVSIADDLLRDAMVELGHARNEIREAAPQVSPETF